MDCNIYALKNSFSSNLLTKLTAEAVHDCSNPNLVKINAALDRWYHVWVARVHRDITQENRTFTGNSMPFLWLAKMFLLLHLHRHNITNDSDFDIAGTTRADEKKKEVIQLRIVSWLMRFRKQSDTEPGPNGHYLAQFIKPPDN